MNATLSKKILVVEDDSDLREIEVSQLRKKDCEVLEAGDGEQALELFEKEKPDLILLDLMLPKVDGFHVLETIRKNSDPTLAKTPVIVLSNLWSDKDILRTEALQISHYFVKSNITMKDVMAKVDEVLKAARRHSEGVQLTEES